MLSRKPKPELNWTGKANRPRQKPHDLIEHPAWSYRAASRGEDPDLVDNQLIFGDNLLALQALEPAFAGKVKCVYIDPPYNTGSDFEHYQDALDHTAWLDQMRTRLQMIRKLLRPDGFICCHIDDAEGHYLKVLMDEVFGRSNYLVTFYVQVRYAAKTLKQDMAFHKQIEQIHIYRKTAAAAPILNKKDLSFDKFCHYISEKAPGHAISLGGKTVTVFGAGSWEVVKREGSPQGLKEIWASGSILDGNSSGRFFRDHLAGRAAIDGLGALYKVEGIGDDGHGHRYFTGPARATATKGKYYQGVPLGKLSPEADAQTLPIENYYDLAGSFGNCRHEGDTDFRSGKKPEALLEIILRHFSAPGDIVLDAFGGSGTTGAVAHKMGRRWIMIERGEHCRTHIVPRLKKVIDGQDSSGATRSAAWQGGGGFRFYTLEPARIAARRRRGTESHADNDTA